LRASRRGPTQAMRSPSMSTAASLKTSSSAISRPRRARAGPRQVTTCRAPTSSVFSRPPRASADEWRAAGPLRWRPHSPRRRAALPALHEIVQGAAEAGTLALPQPTDTGGQALERYALLRQRDPAPQMLALGEQLEHEAISAVQVLHLAR